jgi:N-acetylglutamate synthase-like GNAT family acetyltransferase
MEPVVRRARPSDKAPLMSFIKDVWGGHDYIPSVWDDWIRDKDNEMYVVEVDGVPVGMNRLRFLEDGSAWFEGVRVHPDYRGRGLASMLGANSMKVARESGAKVYRLTSGSRNRTAHRQIARIEFEEMARFSVYEPTRLTKPRSGARRVTSDDASRVLRLMEGSVEHRKAHGVFWHNWGAASLTPETVGRLITEGAVWRRGDAVAEFRKGGEGRRRWEEIGFLGGDPVDAADLASSLLSGGPKQVERWAFVPQGSPIIHALRESGFRRRFSNILFERKAAKG